ncbi:MAG: hypothetical protein K6U80_20030 [Firmicutes bacterium]|nr:hypothetical protein [Bacillota bacterium]
MKRCYIYLFTIIILCTLTIINCLSKEEQLKPILEISKDKVTGKVNCLIIDTKDHIFFFNDKGICIKKLNILHDYRSNYYKISYNHKYIAISEEIKNKNNKYTERLRLLNYNFETIWERYFTDPVSIYGVADDGKRVLIRLSTQYDSDYPVIKYLDEKGADIVSLDGYELAGADDAGVSSNCRYWVCREQYPEKSSWYFFDENGKKYHEQKNINIIDYTITAISDNGYYTMEIVKNSGYESILFDKNGKRIKIIKDDSIYLSKSGNYCIYFDKDYYIFYSIIDNTENKVSEVDIDKKTETVSSQRILYALNKNISYNGDYLIFNLEPRSINEYRIGIIWCDEKIKTYKLKLNQYIKKPSISHYLIKDFLIIYDFSSNIYTLYEIKR